MRPRHKAAENLTFIVVRTVRLPASMRPRHKAAENVTAGRPVSPPVGSFNEAAA